MKVKQKFNVKHPKETSYEKGIRFSFIFFLFSYIQVFSSMHTFIVTISLSQHSCEHIFKIPFIFYVPKEKYQKFFVEIT